MKNKTKIALLLLSSTIVAFIVLLYIYTHNIYMVSSNENEFKPTVVIDPGHGGEDSGAVSDDDILEKDINLKIAHELKSFLQVNGFSVIMTRDSDTSLSDDSLNYEKLADLKNRVNVFNSSNENIVISIHQNKFVDSQYYGTQIFYSKNNENSENLAQCIKRSVVSLLQPDNNRECKKAGSEIYVLDKAKVPSVMVECGFLSNKNEASKLSKDTYQKQIAYCICLGFLEYYYTNY